MPRAKLFLIIAIMPPLTATNWPQLGHTAVCVSGVSSALMMGAAIHAEHVIARERTHLLNNLLLSQPAHQRQRANLVSRLNQLSRKQVKLRHRLYAWASILGLHLVYAGAYLHHRIKK